MERVLIPIYLQELSESVSLCERSIFGLEMGFIKEEHFKAKQYSYVIIDFHYHLVTLVVCDNFRIQVTQSTVGGLPKLYDYIFKNSEKITDISSIKKLALTYIQTIGL